MPFKFGVRFSPAIMTLISMAGIFVIDTWVLDDSNISFAYLLVVMLGLFFSEKNDVILIGAASTVLTILAVIIRYYEGHTLSLEQLLSARVASIGCIGIAVYLVIQILALRLEERTKEEQFHALFEFATNGILIANHQGEIVRANPAAEQLFGYKPDELLGRKVEVLLPRRLTHIHEKYRQGFRANPRPRAMGIGLDLFAMRQDGEEFPVEVSLSPIQTAQGEFVMAFIIDNTIRKENEQRIIRQNQKLEHLAAALQDLNEGLEEKVRERTQALEQARNDLAIALDKERELGELKSRFVSMASHEFRTPLSTMLSSASLINTYAERQDFENIIKHSRRIKTSINNLNTILTEFLSLGKLEEGKTETILQQVNLPELVKEVESEIKGIFRPGQTFHYEHEGPEIATFDPGLFKHILINLFSNAIKYSPDHSKIQVRTATDADVVRLEVRDSGMGIPEADQKHLFSRFFRATNAGNIQGTGLGLYIVQRYVELMNGKISFESREGQGTIFRVELQPNQS